MWNIFFAVCNVLCMLIPNADLRARIRHDKLFDWHKKYRVLKHICPEARFYNVRMIKGGWNIGFIVKNKYVFKIRKFLDKKIDVTRVLHEKQITDAFNDVLQIEIPNIKIFKYHEYTFFRYNYIRGVNLNTCSFNTMKNHIDDWAKMVARIIFTMHNARPESINDLINDAGDGWNHNDICNNMIIDKKTKKIIGLIDWEYSGWGNLETEIKNCDRYSSRLRTLGFSKKIEYEYNKIAKKSN